MHIITKNEFKQLEANYKYARSRWERYGKKVVEILKKEQFDSCLELGPRGMPLVLDSDTIDWTELIVTDIPDFKPTFDMDARILPWPIKDKQYDMFIATQVWEHLGGHQSAIFREVMRVSKKALLSFPYMWKTKDKIHSGIDMPKISKWTCYAPPKYVDISRRTALLLFHF